MSVARSQLSDPPNEPDRGLAAGMRVNDNVVLVRPIGEGGMGSVWVAHHETLKTEVAVKFIGEKLDVDDGDVLERFNREATTAAQIKSPYVVQTFDQGVMSSGIPFMVMELLEGESLDDRIEREVQLELDTTEIIIAQTGKALAAAHARGIIHRDIKPQNIFLTVAVGDLHIKVYDFGIAKQTNVPAIDGITMSGQPVGTPEFMSPEQLFDARNVDHRADLWSLAVVAYCCLTGRLPFEAETLPAMCKLLLRGEHAPPSELRPELTPAVDAWFAKALHPDIQQRFRTAKDMAVSFVRVLSAARFQEANALEALFITSDDTMPPFPLTRLTGEETSGTHRRPSLPENAVRTRDGAKPPTPPLDPVSSKKPARGLKLVGAVTTAFLMVFLAPIRPELRGPWPELRGLFDRESKARAKAVAPAEPPVARAAPASAAPVAKPDANPAPSTLARPTEIDGSDANAWRSVLRGAAFRGDKAIAADAFVALATIEPERFGEKEVMEDAATAAHLAASSSEAIADRVFELLAGDALGTHAADILFRVTSVHGGSPGAKRAMDLLAREDVLARASPALRIALAMREAGCKGRPALFDRAAADGDERTLYLLLQMREDSCGLISCCMKDDTRLINAIGQIQLRAGDEP